MSKHDMHLSDDSFHAGGHVHTRPATQRLKRMAERCQTEFEIEFFDRVLARSANFTEVLRCQADLLAGQGLHERAVVYDARLARLLPEEGDVHYNLACSLAKIGRPAEAVEALRNAVDCGYDDFAQLVQDEDLQALQCEPAFLELLADFGLDV